MAPAAGSAGRSRASSPAIVALVDEACGSDAFGDWRLVPAWANRRPAAISYLRRAGDTEYRAFKLDVLRVQDGLIGEITTFDARMHAAFGGPKTLTAA
jgi:RNA polymerase sigma-70 factor (ECF subfamily)